MSLLDRFFKQKKPDKQDVQDNLSVILKAAPPEQLSLLNKQIEITKGLHLPVAEAMLFIEKYDVYLSTVEKNYLNRIKRTQQIEELLLACNAYQIVNSLNDTTLSERYYNLKFKPKVLNTLLIQTTPNTILGPRKSSKVKYLDFAKILTMYNNKFQVNLVSLLSYYGIK